MKRALYITTTLPYVNADPHIGFALEAVQADIFARYRKLLGDDVFFNTGTDEHGLKIYRKAQEEGKEPKSYVDEYAAKFRSLKDVLGLSSEIHFIRTTDAHHKAAAQEMWRRCAAAGDIYKKKYKGLYCVGDEAFIKESELVNGKCPNHPTMEPMEIEEENYFFRLSAYQEKLLEYLSREGVIVPEWRRQEALQFVRSGLEDFSVSRDSTRLSWGIPVPGDDSQTMYVWFDALTNYISTLGWPCSAPPSHEAMDGHSKASQGKPDDCLYEKFWVNGETLQLAGKDQVRFQSIIWQAMLMSAGLPTTKRIVYHGFITSGGQKMSKSLGNVIDPLAVVSEYGTDALRYFLARHVSPFEDTDVTMEKFKEAYNADLANGLGNTVSRVMQLAQTYLQEPVSISSRELEPLGFDGQIQDFNIPSAVEYVSARTTEFIDKEITDKQPFEVVKTDLDQGRRMIQALVREMGKVASMLECVIPQTTTIILDSIKQNKKPANLFPRKE